MISFCVLGSGSSGNAIFFKVDGVCFLVDCGFTKKEMNRRLATIGRSMDDIQHVFITHDHGDHLHNWVRKEIERRVFMPSITLPHNCNHDPTRNGVWCKSFPLSHDSGSGSVGYTIKDKSGNKIAIVMDTGCIPEEILPNLFDCAAILIECNYDIDMLVESPYPGELQERISSDVGHLRSECAAEAVGLAAWPGLKYVVALHLSRTCINPVLARFELERELDRSDPRDRGERGCEVIISDQKEPTRMITII